MYVYTRVNQFELFFDAVLMLIWHEFSRDMDGLYTKKKTIISWKWQIGNETIYISVNPFFRYSYDPFQQSPNENPEAELYLNAGDYVLVWGNMDEVTTLLIITLLI